MLRNRRRRKIGKIDSTNNDGDKDEEQDVFVFPANDFVTSTMCRFEVRFATEIMPLERLLVSDIAELDILPHVICLCRKPRIIGAIRRKDEGIDLSRRGLRLLIYLSCVQAWLSRKVRHDIFSIRVCCRYIWCTVTTL